MRPFKRTPWTFTSAWAPPLAYAVVIFYVSSQPSLTIADRSLLVWDKMAHLFEYALLALLLLRAWVRWCLLRPFWKNIAAVIIITGAYGLSDEIHQLFVPNRHAEVSDVVMDVLGAVMALCVFLIPRISSRLTVGVRSGQPYSS